MKPTRKAFGQKACEAATEVGVEKGTWSNWEHQRGVPNVGNVHAIAEWSRRHAERLGRPDLAIRTEDWIVPTPAASSSTESAPMGSC